MSEITITHLKPHQREEWDSFVERSNEGTLFHRLDFLSYHGEKFRENEHHLVWLKGQSLFGIMPMSIFEDINGKTARSPYGGSYGGPIFEKPLNYNESRQITESLVDYFSQIGIVSFRMTLPIECCYAKYSETFKLSLLERDFSCVNRDISSVVPLNNNSNVQEIITSRARNMVRRASKSGITISQRTDLADFWKVMEKTFGKHGIKSTHTLSEFQWLCEKLPENIYADVAFYDSQPVAGIGYFVINKRVNSSFYLCQDPEYQNLQGLSLLINEALSKAQINGFSWFDFGTSSVNMQARESLFRFKESFGAVGLFRETYQWQKSR